MTRWHLATVLVALAASIPAAMACEFQSFTMDETIILSLTEGRTPFHSSSHGDNCVFLGNSFFGYEHQIVEGTATATWTPQTAFAENLSLGLETLGPPVRQVIGQSPLVMDLGGVNITNTPFPGRIPLQLVGSGLLVAQPATLHISMTYLAEQELMLDTGSCSSG